MTHIRPIKRYRRIVGESTKEKETSRGTTVTLRYHELECGHRMMIRDPYSVSHALSMAFRKKRLCRKCSWEAGREAARQEEEATVNEILEHEADQPAEFEPNEIDAALQDPNKT